MKKLILLLLCSVITIQCTTEIEVINKTGYEIAIYRKGYRKIYRSVPVNSTQIVKIKGKFHLVGQNDARSLPYNEHEFSDGDTIEVTMASSSPSFHFLMLKEVRRKKKIK